VLVFHHLREIKETLAAFIVLLPLFMFIYSKIIIFIIMMKSFLFTCGDINGIGPEIVIKALREIDIQDNCRYIFAIPDNVYENTCSVLNTTLQAEKVSNAGAIKHPGVYILCMGDVKQEVGLPTALSGTTAFNALKLCFEFMNVNKESALITAPISKTAFKMAGIDFPGHTELLAEWCNTKDFVMTFLSANMKAALLTIHSPVSKLKELITAGKLKHTLNVLIASLQKDFKINNPSIAVLGLNPHAGENGNIGDEEIEIIAPVIKGYLDPEKIAGPFSPDAFFGSSAYKKYDLILGMYHDQVLIPFKLLNFNTGVNFTAGLPIVRTSPDHGTAYDIAGKGLAECNSTIEAYKFADIILSNRLNNVYNL